VIDVVLGPAGQALNPPASVPELTENVRVEALTPDVLLAHRSRRDHRLRCRDEVADALGTVVLASVRSRVPRTTAETGLVLPTPYLLELVVAAALLAPMAREEVVRQ
jgi:hypothetical protein